jgi:hypothetical protein
MLIIPGKRPPLAKGRQEDWEEAREVYLFEHAPGLKEHYAAQQRAFRQIEEDAHHRHPDPTLDDIAAALAAEAALPYRKGTEAQLRGNFEPLAAHLPQDIKSKRKRFVQRGSGRGTGPIPSPDRRHAAGSHGGVREDLRQDCPVVGRSTTPREC